MIIICTLIILSANLRLLDCINRPKELIDRAIELGLAGIAITDHECLSGAVKINQYAQEIKEKYPDFKIALGNEIYLTDTRESGQKYYHFILIAKDKIGHRALRELSSIAWFNSYSDRGMERVPTLKSELEQVVNKYPGHLIATTACLGGELNTYALEMEKCRRVEDLKGFNEAANKAKEFLNYCDRLFGEDFYLEIAPASSVEQNIANSFLYKISQEYGIKMSIGSDAHYLKKDDRWVHKSYLNSKDGEREVDSFYEFTYLQSEQEIREHLHRVFTDEQIDEIFNNSMSIYDKIEEYSLFHKQHIEEVPVYDYPKKNVHEEYPVLNSLFTSDNIQERYWINECAKALESKGLDKKEYWERLEEEATTKRIIGKALETNIFAYPNTLQHYIHMFWELGSLVGAGRGSSCSGLNHYLLGITQLDPIKWDLPWFRYLNAERVELPDIDLDLCPSKRPAIIKAIKTERAQYLNKDVSQFAKENLGCTLIATFGTEETKSAILTACRGYRSEEWPEGIEVDKAQYMSSLIPSERGFLWEIKDVVYGNSDKGRKPVKEFISEVKKFPGLLEIITTIEGLISKRSSHASGVVFFSGDPFDQCAFMKTPKGEIITQFDLHDDEYLGATKYDLLVTEVQDKILTTIQLLQEDKIIDPDMSLQTVYNTYLHPSILPIEDKDLWDALNAGSVINVFQFDSQEGSKTVRKLHPRNVLELCDANGLMRLMSEGERPIDRYARFKSNLDLWYEEMRAEGLSAAEQRALEPYFKPSFGVPPSQEQLMLMLMDKDICNFSLADANAARKIVGKKQMSKIPELQHKVLASAKSEALGQYVWSHGVSLQLGYSFSRIHSLAYSFIGIQTLYMATKFNPLYWDTACLIVNSGSLEDNSTEEIVDIYEPEADDLAEGITFQDLPDQKTKIRKTVATDYGKVAKALGDIRAAGIKISLVDINHSTFGFKPDVENNQILFGLKGMLKIGDDLIDEIIANRPYASIKDFLNKVHINKTAMISLIKGGAFDSMEDRRFAMAWYIWQVCDKKNRLTLQNLPSLIKYNLVPEDDEQIVLARRVYEFTRYLKAITKTDNKTQPQSYILDTRAIDFLTEIGLDALINNSDNSYYLNIKAWDKVYQRYMDVLRAWLNKDKENILFNLNFLIFQEDWNKYAKGNLSSWEMDVLCFYYHEHELKNIDNERYGIVDFFKLKDEPEIESTRIFNGRAIHKFKLYKICGTCIAKNKIKSTVTLLTPTGPVNVKFRKEYFALFDKQISIKDVDGTKHVLQKSWFNRGNMIIVQGIRSGNDFVTKKYNNSLGHQLYRIVKIEKDNSLVLETERPTGYAEENYEAV